MKYYIHKPTQVKDKTNKFIITLKNNRIQKEKKWNNRVKGTT